MTNRGGIRVLGILRLLGTLGILAVGVGCASSNAKDGGTDASTDQALAKGGGTFTCGDAACTSSEVCLVPPCSCITVGDAGGSCPARYCVAPTPENPVSCTPLDGGGLSGTVTSADGGSRTCYHICL
jgi:hypothetical protein